ncbi:MAG: hypothetical protein AAB403_16715 [Planctomycetota bacterium]
MLLDETPDFIGLNVHHWDVDDHPAHELLTLLAGQYQQPKDGIAVNPGDPLGAADAGPFDEQLESEKGLVHGHGHAAQGLLVRLRVGLRALRAAEPPQPIPVLPEALTFAPAVRATHCFACLCLAHHW